MVLRQSLRIQKEIPEIPHNLEPGACQNKPVLPAPQARVPFL